MIDDKKFVKMLDLLFGEWYTQLYEVIDDDMIRKPGIRVTKVKTYENGDEDFRVTINRRLLKKAIKSLGGKNDIHTTN